MSDKKWINPVLILAVVAIFVLSFVMAPRPAGEGEEAFVGTDSVVTEILEAEGTEPWFAPIFEPGSGEIESGLFALQAALGAGLLGFVLGNLRGRAKAGQEYGVTPDPGHDSQPTAAAAGDPQANALS